MLGTGPGKYVLTLINFTFRPYFRKMVHPENFETKIGFDRIRVMLAEKCLSVMGRVATSEFSFMTDGGPIGTELSKTSEFQHILTFDEPFPSENYFDISSTLVKLKIEGTFPEILELFELKRSLETIRSVINYFKSREENVYPVLKSLCLNVKIYPYVSDSIDRILDKQGNVKDNASARLKELRAELVSKNLSVARKLNTILKHAQAEGIVDAETNVSVRNGRGVIPVNVSDKRKIKGLIHDQSASGKTVFIEPAEIVEINNDIVELEYEERREIVRILTVFADNVRPYIDDLLFSNHFIGEIDFIRARALLGIQFGSIKPVLNNGPCISWKKAIHPLLFEAFKKLPGRKVVPLDINLDIMNRILLISGPNAGGKSVCLKSVGLLQYMLQCGLTIPVAEGSEAGIFRNLFIDIGDEQSIDNDLSTYSSHLLNMKFFLKNATPDTMILVDEFGTGTEPMIGGSIAESILSELNRKEVWGIITTHYTNLKHFASVTPGIVNGAMSFDSHLMQPLFQLFIGKPGSSFAFEIAKKIGLPDEVLSAASEKAGIKNINYDRHLKDIARDKRYWENKRQSIRQQEKRLEELVESYEKELSEAKSVRKEIITSAKNEAQALLENSNRLIENTIRQIKETQAEKEKTIHLRKEVEKFKEGLSERKDSPLTESERKVKNLKMKAGFFQNKNKEEVTIIKKSESPPGPGDTVRMKETLATGEIVKVEGNRAQVETGNLKFFVPLDKIERISRAEFKKSNKQTRSAVIFNEEFNEIKLRFTPEIDIRGIRGEEALMKVRELLDSALMLQHRNLRILHGKGNGILRELVRNYLKASGIVKDFRDEHVDMGGSGITVIELDL